MLFCAESGELILWGACDIRIGRVFGGACVTGCGIQQKSYHPSHQICDDVLNGRLPPGVEIGTIHLSPTAPGPPLTARQSSDTCKLPCIAGVPSCGVALAIYLALITIRKLEKEAPMAKLELDLIVGNKRR